MMDLNVGTFERLEEQVGLLHGTYNVELKKDPDSHATALARSNLIAALHTITQIYGEDGRPGGKIRSRVYLHGVIGLSHS